MNLNPDDPRLTAYALGELDEAGRAEIEAALRNSPEAQAEVEAIRATASLLQGEFAGEDALALTPAQRQRLEAVVDESDGQPAFVPRPRTEERRGVFDWMRFVVWGAVGVAAVVLAVAVVPIARTGGHRKAKPVTVAAPNGGGLPTAEKPESERSPGSNALLGESGRKGTENYFDGAKVDGDKLADGPGVTTLAVVPPVDSATINAPASASTDVVGKLVEKEIKPHTALADTQSTRERDNAVQLAGGLTALGVETRGATPGHEGLDPLSAGRAVAGLDASAPAVAPQSPQGPAASPPEPILARRYGLAPAPTAADQPPKPATVQTAPASPVPVTSERMVERARSDLERGRVAEAETKRNETAKLNSDSEKAYYYRGLAREQRFQGESGEARKREATSKDQLAQVDKASSAPRGGGYLGGQKSVDESRLSTDSYQAAESQPRYLYFKTPHTPGAESYAPITDNPFREVTASPLSTFSIDVDTASYANVRRFLREGQRPPPDAVRIEELVNYFNYDYPQPRGEHPFSATVDVATCPWTPDHKLVRIGIKAKSVERRERAHANLVFLIDVSGSMEPENKLPLVKRGLRLLVDRLGGADYVGIVTYAGRAEVALEPTSCDDKATILAAIDRLAAGSGTNGGEGIQRAYEMARRRFEKSAINRIILCTDGDFNVGITSRDELKSLIENEAKSGVFLSVLGFGMGNTKDDTMEMLADKGNGHYGYVDSFTEARKVFSEQLEGTLVTVAKDVKIQVEFNPAKVATWRLLGYENRVMADRDFNDDRKDAGEMGAGHSVTALYEVVPLSMVAGDRPEIDGLRYRQTPAELETREKPRVRPAAQHADELLFLKVRYKKPDGDQSILMEHAVKDGATPWKQAPADFKFAAAVAGFGMILRDSPHRGDTSFDSVLSLAEEGLGRDENGYRAEFIDLVRKAQSLK